MNERLDDFNAALKAITGCLDRNSGSVSRAHFQKLCRDHKVCCDTMQGLLEAFGLRVVRKGAKKQGDDRFTLEALR